MKDKLRNQLIALGIPPERHDAASLAALFPPEFDISDLNMNSADTAEVLLTFVERGLIRVTDEDPAKAVGNAHLCLFYRTQEELASYTAAYLEEGLRAGERCLWVLPSWLPVEKARAASRKARQGNGDAEETGRLRYLGEGDVYFGHGGRMRTPAEIIAFWLSEESDARQRGFTGLRVTGEATPLLSSEMWRSGVEYEKRADAAFKGRRVSALCGYSLEANAPERLAKVLGAHSKGVLRRSGHWVEMRPGTGIAAVIELLR